MALPLGEASTSPAVGRLLNMRAWRSEPGRYTVPPAPQLRVLAVYVNGVPVPAGAWQYNGPRGHILLTAPDGAVVTADLDYPQVDQPSKAGSRHS